MIWLVIGRREQGKTTLAMSMALRVPARLIFDPRGMIRPDAPRAETPAELDEAMDDLFEGRVAEVRFTPRGDVEEGFVAFATAAAAWVRADVTRPLAVVVDEAGFVPRSNRVAPFMWLCRCSRRDTIQIIMTAHRPLDISTSVRAISDHWLIYPCRQEHDLRVLEERCSESAMRAIARLKDRQFLAWDDAHTTSRLYEDPAAWYVNLSDPQPPATSLADTGTPLPPERRSLFDDA